MLDNGQQSESSLKYKIWFFNQHLIKQEYFLNNDSINKTIPYEQEQQHQQIYSEKK